MALGGSDVTDKAKVKRTKSRATMKRLLREGWELQGVEGKKIYNAMSWGGTAYILVKKPEPPARVAPSRTLRSVRAAGPSASGDVGIGSHVVIAALGYRGKTGTVTKLTERSVTVKLDDGGTARMIPPDKVEVLAEE
jgi:ribosomal protein L21E